MSGMSMKNTVESVRNADCRSGHTVHHRVVMSPSGDVGPAMMPNPPHASRMRWSTMFS